MLQRVLWIVPTMALAFGILLISVLRTASVKYEFSRVVTLNGTTQQPQSTGLIEYRLAPPGKVLPGSLLWPLKAARDRLWLVTTTNPSRKAELLLLFADKRLAASKNFFERGEIDDGYLTLLKAEQYLNSAFEKERQNAQSGIDTLEFLKYLRLASLKHREVIQLEILILSPDEVKPKIVKAMDTTKEVYYKVDIALSEKGISFPENPFDSQ